MIPRVKAIHKISRLTYGKRRIAEELQSEGISCGEHKAGTLMKLADVQAKQKKKFKAKTDSKHSLPVSPNLLKRELLHAVTVSSLHIPPNKSLVDITNPIVRTGHSRCKTKLLLGHKQSAQ